jgi:LysM repeat protein
MLVFKRLICSPRILLTLFAGLVALLATTAALPAGVYAQGNPGAETFMRPAPNLVPYVVRPGDTLSSIARQHNTTVAALMDWNPQIQNPNRLTVGQQIWVPSTGPGSPQPPAGPRPPAEIPPSARPPAPDFTRTQVFFIALANTGPGWSAGCGGNAAPATVYLTPATEAVLRGSLEYLLSLRDPYYRNTGLYNALFRSRLTLSNLSLENGVATIRLSGQLATSGACDSARIQAQLEQTALQFSTVNQVVIFINGERFIAPTPF